MYLDTSGVDKLTDSYDLQELAMIDQHRQIRPPSHDLDLDISEADTFPDTISVQDLGQHRTDQILAPRSEVFFFEGRYVS